MVYLQRKRKFRNCQYLGLQTRKFIYHNYFVVLQQAGAGFKVSFFVSQPVTGRSQQRFQFLQRMIGDGEHLTVKIVRKVRKSASPKDKKVGKSESPKVPKSPQVRKTKKSGSPKFRKFQKVRKSERRRIYLLPISLTKRQSSFGLSRLSDFPDFRTSSHFLNNFKNIYFGSNNSYIVRYFPIYFKPVI